MVRVGFYRPALDTVRVPSFKCEGASAWDLFLQLECGPSRNGPKQSQLDQKPSAEHEEVFAVAGAGLREEAATADATAPGQSHEEVPAAVDAEEVPAGADAAAQQDPCREERPACAGATAQGQGHGEVPCGADAAAQAQHREDTPMADGEAARKVPDPAAAPGGNSCGEADDGDAQRSRKRPHLDVPGQGQAPPAGSTGTPSPSVGGWWQAGGAGAAQPQRHAEHDADLERALLESASEYAQQVSIDEARSGRLQRIMDLYHARVRPVQADGNCQFRALSLQLYGDEGYHGDIRARVVQQLEAAPERYAGFVHEPFADYLERLARHGEWGDNVTLQAACDALDTDIRVLTDVEHAECIEVHPTHRSGDPGAPHQKPPLCLAFLTEVHYDAAELLQ